MTIGTNTSPLAGKVKGHKLTARLVKDRLDRELIGNVSLKVVDIGRPDAWEVQGRGELALAILVENMRREGFELTVGKPQVDTQNRSEGRRVGKEWVSTFRYGLRISDWSSDVCSSDLSARTRRRWPARSRGTSSPPGS